MLVYELIAKKMNPKDNIFQFIYHMRYVTFNHIEKGITENVKSRLNDTIDARGNIYYDIDDVFLDYTRFVRTRIFNYKNFINRRLISYSYETKD
jgi:hypothetical protein